MHVAQATRTRAVVYARVSSDDLRMKRSVGEQEQESRVRAAELGADVVKVLVDNDRSASRFARKQREQYPLLLDYLRTGDVDLLILWESSRGDRELERWAGMLNLCRARGIRIHIVTHQRTYDLNVARDWKALAADGVENAYFVEEHRERVLRTKRASAAKGRPAGKLLFGYVREYDDRGRFIAQRIRDDQADIVREAADRVYRGESCRSIAVDFNTRGVRTPRYEPLIRKAADSRQRAARETGLEDSTRRELLAEAQAWETEAAALRWDLTQIRRLVTNPAYVAQRVYQGRVVGPGDWPPILDEDVWTECVTRLADPARKTQRDSSVKHLLSGVARCGICGSRMRVQKVRNYYGYLCVQGFHTFVKLERLEDFVTRLVIERLRQPDVLELLSPPDSRDAAKAAKDEADELQRRLDGFRDQAADGGITPEGMARIEARLVPQIAAARERSKVRAVPALLREAAGPDAAEKWEGFSIGQRREIVGLLVELKVGRTVRGARTFDPRRLGESRWIGDMRTWSQIWESR